MRRIVFLVAGMIVLAIFPPAGEAQTRIQAAVGLRGPSGFVRWILPGQPARIDVASSLVFEFLASRDCYLYAIALPDAGAQAYVLWPRPWPN